MNPPDSCCAKSSITVTDNEANGLFFSFLFCGERVIRLICSSEVTSLWFDDLWEELIGYED